jgi:transposase
MHIDIRGLTGERRLQIHVRNRMSAVLTRLRVAPLAARVAFADENGPKGGVDIQCALTVRLPFRASVHVAHMGSSHRRAFDEAFAVFERQLERDIERGRELRRRPKKYYVAKRLLASGPHRVESPVRRAV